MTRFLTLFDTVVTDPLEDIPTVNELEKWLKNVGEQAFYFFIRLAAAGLLLFIGSKLIKFLMNPLPSARNYIKKWTRGSLRSWRAAAASCCISSSF